MPNRRYKYGDDVVSQLMSPRGQKANVITARTRAGAVFTVKDRWGAPECGAEWLRKNPDVELKFYADRARTIEVK